MLALLQLCSMPYTLDDVVTLAADTGLMAFMRGSLAHPSAFEGDLNRMIALCVWSKVSSKTPCLKTALLASVPFHLGNRRLRWRIVPAAWSLYRKLLYEAGNLNEAARVERMRVLVGGGTPPEENTAAILRTAAVLDQLLAIALAHLQVPPRATQAQAPLVFFLLFFFFCALWFVFA